MGRCIWRAVPGNENEIINGCMTDGTDEWVGDLVYYTYKISLLVASVGVIHAFVLYTFVSLTVFRD